MDKVELKFVVDIVGHDEATIIQMYNDWLGNPLNYRNNNSSQLGPLVSLRAVFEEIIKIANEGKHFIINEDFGGNTLTIAVNDKHTHCGTPNGTFEQLVESLHQTLIERKGLSWE